MREALLLAREAAADGEVPVGCVITLEDRIVGRGRNRREKGKTALAHAELEAIGEASIDHYLDPEAIRRSILFYNEPGTEPTPREE